MNEQAKIDNWVDHLLNNLPDDLKQVKTEFKKNLITAIQASLTNMDLVTREEFEIQKALLSRTRALLEEMEEKISQLEDTNRD